MQTHTRVRSLALCGAMLALIAAASLPTGTRAQTQPVIGMNDMEPVRHVSSSTTGGEAARLATPSVPGLTQAGPPVSALTDDETLSMPPEVMRAYSQPEPNPAERAIAAAEAELGKPYCWGGTGSRCFDCSGLVGHAYRAAGIELPRTSRAQYAALPRVPLDEIEPGDLVFSGHGRIGHVGLYIGDGLMIHSPQSGRHVEIAPLRSNLIGAARPT